MGQEMCGLQRRGGGEEKGGRRLELAAGCVGLVGEEKTAVAVLKRLKWGSEENNRTRGVVPSVPFRCSVGGRRVAPRAALLAGTQRKQRKEEGMLRIIAPSS